MKPIDFVPSGIKFTHWEFNKINSTGQLLHIDPKIRITPVHKPGTTITNGLLFRHSVRLYTDKGFVLSCVAEEIYMSDDIKLADFPDIKKLVEYAFNKFNSAFHEKTIEEGMPASLYYEVKDRQVNAVLQKLKA